MPRSSRPSPSVDIFSFGAMLLELKMGEQLPGHGDAWERLRDGALQGGRTIIRGGACALHGGIASLPDAAAALPLEAHSSRAPPAPAGSPLPLDGTEQRLRGLIERMMCPVAAKRPEAAALQLCGPLERSRVHKAFAHHSARVTEAARKFKALVIKL